MAVNHSSVATTHLPSFKQAFSATSLDRIAHSSNALPPISSKRALSPVSRTSSRPNEDDIVKTAGKKRSRAETMNNDESVGSDSEHRIKEEPEEMRDSSPPPSSRAAEADGIGDTPAPPPSSVHPVKKRRTTVSGGPRPGALNTDVTAPADPTNSTPISPVVIGFTVDNPSAVEQVRSMITVKQKQKALIEQRRGSAAGLPTPATHEAPKATPARPVRRSPIAGTGSRRSGSNRPPSPTPVMVPTQQPPSGIHSLPPPPISFARRRASQVGGGVKKKPADILISPREEQTQEQFAPSIQSAPPIPHGGQGPFYSGRFSMTLPRLPSVLGAGDNVRRTVGGNVPPTPTRLASMRSSTHSVNPIPAISGRSPPTASVAISSSLVPPTPHSLHRPGYSGDKSAFLAPFEIFYDALNDSKQLKAWLGEQLQRSQTLAQNLTQQQEKLHELVDSLVEKRVSGMKHEIAGLYRRIDELEDALRASTGRRLSNDKSGGKGQLRNGIPMIQESYTFPPIDPNRLRADHDRAERSLPSPSWRPERDREAQHSGETGSEHSLSESRRMSLPTGRFDPEESRSTYSSPPVAFRDSPHLPPPVNLLRVGTQNKSPRIPPPDRDQEMADIPPSSRKDERRNSVAVLPES